MQAAIATPSSSAPPSALPSAPRGCTSFKLRQLARVVSQHYDAHVSKTGLKTTQYSLLTAVLHLGPLRLGDLAQVMRMDASTLTRNMRPLLAEGWLAVEVQGRSRAVQITSAGRAKREEARRHWRSAQDAFNARVGMDRVAALHALIDDVLVCLDDAAAKRGRRG